MNKVCEYDGYVIPKPIKKETPETKAKLEEALKRLDFVVKKHHKADNMIEKK